MNEKDFEKKNGGIHDDEAAISDFESEGGLVPAREQNEAEKEGRKQAEPKKE